MNRNALDKAIATAGGRPAFAQSLNVSVSTVDKWATGDREPRPAKVLLIEAMYGIPREQLMPTLFRRSVV